MEEKGVKRRVRKYMWGVVDVENKEISDFIALKEFLFGFIF